MCGERRIRTSEGVRQQIYSLPQLATLVSLSYIGSSYFWDCKDKSFLKNTKTILKILKLSSDKAVRPGPITAVTGAFS